MSQIVSPFGAAELNGLLGFDLLHRTNHCARSVEYWLVGVPQQPARKQKLRACHFRCVVTAALRVYFQLKTTRPSVFAFFQPRQRRVLLALRSTYDDPPPPPAPGSPPALP
jgi:hypothetical protein